MRISLFTWSLTSLWLWGCASSPQEDQEAEVPTDLAIYGYYHTDPHTGFAQEENAIIDFLAEHYPSATRIDTGVYLQVLSAGAGDTLQWGDLIQVSYAVSALDGKVFDGTERRGEPLKTYIGNGVDGWNIALQQLQVGSHAIFALTSSRAYGADGFGNRIPAYTPLIFEVTIEAKLDPNDD